MNKEILHLFNQLCDVMSELNGISAHTRNFLDSQAKRVKEVFKGMPVSPLTSNYLLRDLSATSLDDSSEYFHSSSYGVEIENAPEQIETNKNFHFCLTLSYAYELFEIYIKELLRIIEKHDNTTFIENGNNLWGKDQKKLLANLRTKDNDKYFTILRRIAPHILEFEQKNCREINLQQWYKAFSKFRHSVVHTNLICSNETYILHKKNIDMLFPVIKHCKSANCQKWRFKISYDTLSFNLKLIGEYAFLITAELGDKYNFEIKET